MEAHVRPFTVQPCHRPWTTSLRSGAALAVALLGFFVITLDALVVSVALPAISRDLGGGITGLQWIIDGYTLMFAAPAAVRRQPLGPHRRPPRLGSRPRVVRRRLRRLRPRPDDRGAGRGQTGPRRRRCSDDPTIPGPHPPGLPGPRAKVPAIGIWGLGGALASAVGPLVGGSLSLLSWRLIFFVTCPSARSRCCSWPASTHPRADRCPSTGPAKWRRWWA